MFRKILTLICCGTLTVGLVPAALAQSNEADLQKQITELREKLDALEKKLDESNKAQEAGIPTVTAAVKGSKIKIDGRIFAGLFETGDEGASPNWGTDINDAKLRFTFNPAKNITIVNRLSTTGAKTPDFDYFYADFAGVVPNSIIRLGQRKIDVGQETWVDNPVENMLITTSVSHVSGYATGLALLGKFKDTKTSPLYEVGFVNGAKGAMARPTNGLPLNFKLGVPLPKNLFASASYFTSADIRGTDKSGINVGEVGDAPAGATEWKRNLWEVDLRYNYGPNGIRSLIPIGSLPPVMLGATYGAFSDDAVGAADRDGDFWFVEGLFRLNSRTYAAARYSVIDLDNGVVAKLGKSPVAVNSYKRTSIGLGYALSELTQMKVEYTINDTSGGLTDPDLDQFAVGVATKF